jgi:3-hydroxyisobutyrate dehydrogenase-like beta-hydroxyacid dehydrogenase
MGHAMATNLVHAGHTVRAWNRSKLDAASLEGIEIVGRVADAFQGDVAITMLSDDAAIREVIVSPGVLAAARKPIVHVVTSTISLAFVDELVRLHEAAGVGYVAAPVLGRPDAARAAQLHVIAAGPDALIEQVHPVLEAVSRKIWVMGRDPRQANAAKIACNMLIIAAVQTLAEAFVLTGANDVAQQDFLSLITGTLFGGRVHENYGANIVRGNFEPGFKIELGLKDLRLATEAAAAAGRQLPVLDAVRGQVMEAIAHGRAGKDWSAVADYTLRPGN